MKKKFLSVILALAMVLSLMPMAFAAGTDDDSTVNDAEALNTAISSASADADNPTTIKLGTDIAVTARIEIPSGKYIILDLNEKTLTNNGNNNYTIYNGGTLTVTNGTINGGSSGSYVLYSYGENTTIKDVSITSSNNRMVYLYNAPLTIESGTFTQNGNYNLIYAYGSSSKVTIKGGTFINNGNQKMLNYYSSGSYAISGGNFNQPVDAAYFAAGYALAEGENGSYNVQQLTENTAPVVLTYIDGNDKKSVYYADPAAAFNAASGKTDAVVTVVKDVTTTSALYAYKGKLVVNEGVTLTCGAIMVSTTNCSGVTVENNGTIRSTSYITGNSGNATLVNNGDIVCTFTSASSTGTDNENWVNNGTITVNGTGNSTLKYFTNNGTIKGGADGVKMIVSDGVTGSGTSYAAGTYIWSAAEEKWLPAGTFLVIRDGQALAGFDNASDAIAYAQDGDTLQLRADYSGVLTVAKTLTLDLNGHTISYGSSISNVGVVTVENGGSLTVIDSTAGDTEPVISGDGTVTYAAGKIKSTFGVDAVYVKSGGTFTLESGIVEGPANDNRAAIYIGNADIGAAGGASAVGATSAVVNINGGLVSAPYYVGVIICGTGTTNNPQSTDPVLNVTGGVISAKSTAIIGQGQYHNTVINISDGTIQSTDSVAIYHPQYGTLNVTGGAIEGATGIEMRAGILNVSGDAAITGQADEFKTQANGSGSTVLGAGIAVSQHTTNLPVEVNISAADDGTAPVITGNYALYEVDLQDENTDDITLNISAGDFIGTDDAAVSSANVTGFVTGGNYSDSVNPDYLDEKLTAELVKSSGDAPYSYYTSVEEALEDAQPGDTVNNLRSDDSSSTTPAVTLNYGYGNKTITVNTETITLPTASRPGYRFLGWSVNGKTYQAGQEVKITADTTITAQWAVIPTAAPGNSVTTKATTNGTLTVTPSNASKNTTVTITATPKAGYELSSLTVTDANGNRVPVTQISDTKFTFTMPNSKVTVSAAFTKVETPVAKLPFTDVAENAWYTDAVRYVYENDLMNGTGDGTTFSLYMPTTRGMIMTVLARMNGVNTNGSSPWYQIGLDWAVANGVSDGTDPGRSITRQELATMLWRYAGSPVSDQSLSAYSDADQTASWAETAMRWAVENGLLEGNEKGLLNPTGTATRVEVATILMRFCENVLK